MAAVPRRGRGAAVIGLAVLLGTAATSVASPVPTPPPLPVRPPVSAPPRPQPFLWASPAVSDVALVTLAEKIGPITSVAGAGDSRLFLTLRDGRVVVWNGTRLLRGPFLDLRDRVSTEASGGLFSIAIDPEFSSTGFVFLTYTDKAGHLVLARYRRSGTRRNRADPRSGVALLTIPFPAGSDHYGGGLQFGPDGFLYAGIGDGGSAARPSDNAQRDDVLLGKILRLDVRALASTPPFYAIPASNPFAGAGPPLDEIWAKGLRDPWRFSFDRMTGDLYIGDVGEGTPQKIHFQPGSSPGGENYGWPAAAPGTFGLRPPMLTYSRPDACAVVGGYVYRGARDPRLTGVYFYGDYCTGYIWARGEVTNVRALKLTAFGEDQAGELYAATESGNLYRLTSTFPPAPGSQVTREPRQIPYQPPPPPFETFSNSEAQPPSAPMGTFQPPTFEPPFPAPGPISYPGPEYTSDSYDEPAAVDQSPAPDQQAPPPPTPEPPPPSPAPDRQAPAPPPEHPSPRVVEPRR